MLVSVIIPVRDREAFVGRAAASVLSQTWTDLELIVVDDGSRDRTRDVLAAVKDDRLTVITQENKGVSAARNRGLSLARGGLLALLDSDDHWLADKTVRQVRFMAETGFSVSQTGETWIRNERRVNPGRRHLKPSGWFWERSLELCLVSPSCVMFTREFLDRAGGFDESLPACEDYELWLRAGRRFACGYLPEDLVVRRSGHPGQLSSLYHGMDLFRIKALSRQIVRDGLTGWDLDRALSVLKAKVGVHVQGCLKRGLEIEALSAMSCLSECLDRLSAAKSPACRSESNHNHEDDPCTSSVP
ncbi:MAG: glycosyltransferase [Deltaproteobacteria bacterium]|nr:glycosyltransferase [Deltaproteobacteria bacterium]